MKPKRKHLSIKFLKETAHDFVLQGDNSHRQKNLTLKEYFAFLESALKKNNT